MEGLVKKVMSANKEIQEAIEADVRVAEAEFRRCAVQTVGRIDGIARMLQTDGKFKEHKLLMREKADFEATVLLLEIDRRQTMNKLAHIRLEMEIRQKQHMTTLHESFKRFMDEWVAGK